MIHSEILSASWNFIWNPFGIHSEICSNTPNAHSEILDKVFRIIHSEIPSATWNFSKQI